MADEVRVNGVNYIARSAYVEMRNDRDRLQRRVTQLEAEASHIAGNPTGYVWTEDGDFFRLDGKRVGSVRQRRSGCRKCGCTHEEWEVSDDSFAWIETCDTEAEARQALQDWAEAEQDDDGDEHD